MSEPNAFDVQEIEPRVVDEITHHFEAGHEGGEALFRKPNVVGVGVGIKVVEKENRNTA